MCFNISLFKTGEDTLNTDEISDLYESDSDSNETHTSDNYIQSDNGDDLNMLIIEINKAEQLRNQKLAEFNEFNRMNNTDEIIESNHSITLNDKNKYELNYRFNEEDELMLNYVCCENGSLEESEDSNSISQQTNSHNLYIQKNYEKIYKNSRLDEQQKQMTDIDLTVLPKEFISSSYLSDASDGYNHTHVNQIDNQIINNYSNHTISNSLIEYDDLYIDQEQKTIDQSIAEQNPMDSHLLIRHNLIDSNLIDENLLDNCNSVDHRFLYDKSLLTEDLDLIPLSKLIVPPPPKLDSNLEEQNELLRTFKKATEDMKKMCQENSEQVNLNLITDYDYSNCFNSNNTQIARDLHSSSSADSGYESVLINNSQKLIDSNQKLINGSLEFDNNNSSQIDNYAHNFKSIKTMQPPKAPKRFIKLRGILF